MIAIRRRSENSPREVPLSIKTANKIFLRVPYQFFMMTRQCLQMGDSQESNRSGMAKLNAKFADMHHL